MKILKLARGNFFTQNFIKKLRLLFLFFVPLCTLAQQNGRVASNGGQAITSASGMVTDAASGKPLPFVNVNFNGSNYGSSSKKDGKFILTAPGMYNQVTFSYQGYQPVVKVIKPGQRNELQIKLRSSQTQLNEVSISSGKTKKYHNKGNPAVELIQQVIDHKAQNRMESTGYLQYDQYERIGLSLFNLSPKLINGPVFSKYKFMLDTNLKVNGQTQTSIPVFFNEKLSQNFYCKSPEKTIQLIQAEKGINILKFIDTAGLNIYLNRLYGDNIDIYENNIFIITNQFLSPIANHAPDYYKFFIVDTIQTATEKLIELSFTPRAKGDLLFEGKILVTLDGRYAVQSCELNVNKQININFMRSLQINLDFNKYADGHYYLVKSDVKADFGLLKDKGTGVYGERTVIFSAYKQNMPQPPEFYKGKSLQTAIQTDTAYLTRHRTDTLTAREAGIYGRVNKLSAMPSFKRATWIASTVFGGFADLGPVALGPVGTFFAYDRQEGIRLQLGGRTTPQFNKTIYLDGFGAYGIRDQQFKYNLNTYFALNKTPNWRFPNDYFKIGYIYDIDLPGQNLAIVNPQAVIASSFTTGSNDYWLYNKIFTVAYVKDFENHFSYNIAIKNWNQQAAGTLIFQDNDASHTLVHNLTTSEVQLGLRYAPHEQIIQGTLYRQTILSKYPIINVQINHGFTGFLHSSYTYNNIYSNIYKRFYFSQLGYSDVTLLGGILLGKVPFPLLNISPANQSVVYDPDSYNQMHYLEFVTDHYVGLNFTQSFSGFFLNKIPLIEHLKWREYLSAKILYGGLRTENNPVYTKGLYDFPASVNGATGTYAFGNTPYIEGGAGIGNIFKIIRVDYVRRFNYLSHPGVAANGIKLTFSPDF